VVGGSTWTVTHGVTNPFHILKLELSWLLELMQYVEKFGNIFVKLLLQKHTMCNSASDQLAGGWWQQCLLVHLMPILLYTTVTSGLWEDVWLSCWCVVLTVCLRTSLWLWCLHGGTSGLLVPSFSQCRCISSFSKFLSLRCVLHCYYCYCYF